MDVLHRKRSRALILIPLGLCIIGITLLALALAPSLFKQSGDNKPYEVNYSPLKGTDATGPDQLLHSAKQQNQEAKGVAGLKEAQEPLSSIEEVIEVVPNQEPVPEPILPAEPSTPQGPTNPTEALKDPKDPTPGLEDPPAPEVPAEIKTPPKTAEPKTVKKPRKAKKHKKKAAKEPLPPSPYPVPFGLKNPSNYCFFNSVLQCFAAIYPYLRPYSNQPNEPYYELIKMFDETLLRIRDGRPGKAIKSHPLYSKFKSDAYKAFKRLFRGYQEDAVELLQLILNYTMNEHKGFKEAFHISQNNFLQCSCGHEGIKSSKEFFGVIQLDAEESDLETLLQRYHGVEEMTDYKCDSCNGTKVSKQTLFEEPLPSIYVMSLARFRYDKKTKTSSKVDTKVHIPEQLTLSATDDDKNVTQSQTYKLFGISLHGGSLSGGHYTALVRYPSGTPGEDDNWFYCNDSSVSKVTLSEFLKDGNYGNFTPYILFYIPVSDVASTEVTSNCSSKIIQVQEK